MDNQQVDPVIWVVASVAITSVGVIAQLAQLSIAWVDQPKSGIKISPSRLMKGHLRDAVVDCSRDIERIIRLVPRLEGVEFDALDRPFRFGETSLFMTKRALHEYSSAVERLLMSIQNLSHLTYAMIGDDPEFASTAGAQLLRSFSDIKDRVNRFYVEGKPVGDVLGGCLEVLKEFERILIRLEGDN